jgi:hypothetical protein
MQCDTTRIKGWGKPNLMHNVMEKTFEGKHKKGTTKQANNQMPTLGCLMQIRW